MLYLKKILQGIDICVGMWNEFVKSLTTFYFYTACFVSNCSCFCLLLFSTGITALYSIKVFYLASIFVVACLWNFPPAVGCLTDARCLTFLLAATSLASASRSYLTSKRIFNFGKLFFALSYKKMRYWIVLIAYE